MTPDRIEILKAPFPWFGGKSRVAGIVWSRFGPDVQNYVEPFAGSLAVLLGRPAPPRIETVNDLDCYVANFWRALAADPEAVAHWADWPVNEADLHARHQWLVDQAEWRARMHREPDYWDAKIAGWWVWGICAWIGRGWCVAEGKTAQQRPNLGDAGRGLNQATLSQQRPHIGRRQGVENGIIVSTGLHDYMAALADRLRRVRVCCGDWSRVLGESPTIKLGTTAVFLDPPYSAEADRDAALYSQEDLTVAHAVREWALANGDNPMLRICLCGYEDEYAMPPGWECVAWKTEGGYGSQSNGRGRDNGHRERLWFSPHCLRPARSEQMEMFGGDAHDA